MKAKTKKAVMLTMEATIGAIAVLIVIFASISLFGAQESEDALYMLRMGDDTIMMLDLQGYIQTMNNNTILNNMTAIIQNNYDMAIEATNYNFSGGGFVKDRAINVNTAPENKILVSNSRIVVSTSSGTINQYIFVRYWVWLK